MKKIISYKEFLNESKSAIVTEASQEEQIKKEVISKLSDFFGCAPGNLSKFNFDGKDNIKELTKALRSTSDEGTAQYYRIAIQLAKRDLGINESEELNEANISMYKSMVQNVLKDLDVEVKQSEIKVGTKKSDGWNFVTLNGHVLCSDTSYDQMVAWAKASIKEDPAKYSLPTSLKESEEFEINEAVSTPEELASFIQKEEKHFATFLKPKKLTVTVNGKIVTIKPGSGSFTITVDFAKSTIDTTGKPEWPESTSYVELMEYIKKTKFKLNESIVNEAFNNYGWYLRLPKNVINNELKSVTKNLQNYYDAASKGNDLQQDVLEEIINELEKVKKQLKIFTKGQKPTGVYESAVNEKTMDTKYWADYNKDTSGQGEKSWEEKSKEFEDTFEEAVVLWNREAEGPENRIKGAQIQNIKKLAEEFFKIEKWISVNVIQAMIMQES